MLSLSYDDFITEIYAAYNTRVSHGDGTFTYTGSVPFGRGYLYPIPEAEREETKKILDIEKYGIDKHFKTHHGKVPPPLVLKNPVTENVAKRIILRLSREFHVTVEVGESNTTLSFTSLAITHN